jgi:prepilin-type N-terminal cleavage/methylation domain-containing protein
MKKIKEQKDKGFTLVELIVVIVILAILAAILVPALLGYIDKAKKQQIVLNAKSCLTAAQAEFSNIYATSDGSGTITITDSVKNSILDTADVPDCKGLVVGVIKGSDTTKHSYYTIKYVKYTEGSNSIYYNGSTWSETAPDSDFMDTVTPYTIK